LDASSFEALDYKRKRCGAQVIHNEMTQEEWILKRMEEEEQLEDMKPVWPPP
jgi:hypothetical protein